MSKFIFIDLDGTLVHGGGDTLSPSTKEALTQAHLNGHKLIVCTGRSQGAARTIDFEMDGYISGAGSYISLFDKVLLDNPIEKELHTRIIEKAKELEIAVTHECLNECYCSKYMYDMFHGLGLENRYTKYWVPVEGYKGEPTYKMLVETFDQKAMEILVDTFKDELNFYEINKGDFYRSEAVSKNNSKAKAILKIVEMGYVKLEDTIGIGDSFNDLEMLQTCGQSVAMGNAFEEIKPYATIVTDDIDHDGIYNAFKKLGLI